MTLSDSTWPNAASGITLADALMLVSFWKPLIYLVILGMWAWIISTVYDKHAKRFFLPREKWNLFHMIMATVAIIAAFMMPIEHEIGGFLAGLGVLVVMLGISLVAYAMAANKDDRVPQQFHIKLDILKKMSAAREAKKKDKNQAQVKLAIRMPDKNLMPAPQAESPEFEVRTISENLYLKAMESRASQVDIAPTGKDNAYAATMLVDGVRSQAETWPAPSALKVMDFWRSAAKLDLADRRRKQTADFFIEKDGGKKKVRLTSIGVQGGMRVTMLFDPEDAVRRKPDQLGLLDVQMEEVKLLVSEAKGLVLVAGMPDNGRTTNLYTLLGMHDAYTLTVGTLEVDQQLTLEGVRHQVFDPTVEGSEFSTTVRSLLRRDPNVLGISEVPDATTAKELAKAELERTRVYACVRADNALAAIDAWVRLVGDPELAAKHLRGVVVGRLLRKLCVNCRVEYPPAPDMLKKLGVPEGRVTKLFKKGGQVLIKNKPEVCPVCAGVGYAGQEGIFEIYSIGQEERDLVAQNNMAGLKAALRKRQLPTMQQAAIRKSLSGVTSVEEVMRVTSTPAPVVTPAAAPAKT